MASRSSSIVLALACALTVTGCGTTLLQTKIPTSEESLGHFHRGGETWGCHERTSDVFRLYLVCPRQDTVLGVKDVDGRLAFACPDLRKKDCRRFVSEMRRTGGYRRPEGSR